MMKYQLARSLGSAVILLIISCLPALAAGLQTSPQTEADELNAQVVQLFKEKKFTEALPLAKRTWELREKSLGPGHQATLNALQNLGTVYAELGRHAESAKHYRRLLEIQEKLDGQSSIALANLHSKLGWQLLLDNNNGAAAESFGRGLKIREASSGSDSMEIIPALNDLAQVSHRMGQYSKSIGYFQRMIQIREKHLGENHPNVAELLSKCAIILRQAGKKAEADAYEARVRQIYSAMSGGAEAQEVAPQVLQGTAILKVQPDYPASARRNRVQGTVLVRVKIDEAGFVTEAVAVSGPNELRRDSEEAARQWRFKPTIHGGRAIKVMGILTFNFVLP